ncbi:Transcriptional regulator LsrR [Austwickia sp. TVS 96-490-7B]|uniref:sugar-binding transcriptional regulator n=1 Tax=Austwickia sp. TVS 96-490-7B TaxID=2830843 RepID=UPI001C59ED23|nr:sugar-binding transcriptional regulator [Austwickia sp. TVS 96-490-7B]MBW3084623.1 Transcriptional regulator LsrR [Austwickia sp. TVS 96-490-7B]
MPPDREHLSLLTQVARWYYLDDLSQDAIAARVHLSRSRVSRLLTEARDRRIVRFVIGHPLERAMALEDALRERFGLREARVAEPAEGSSAMNAVAVAAADVVADAARNATVLATSAGTTLAAVVDELPQLALHDLCVVQMIGALSKDNPLTDSPDLTRRLAERLGGTYRLMPTPLIVGSARLAHALRREEAVANALALASHADVALVGIGALDPNGASGPIFTGWLTPQEGAYLSRLGAVGHISGHHFDATGAPLRTDLRDRVMSVPLDHLHRVHTVIGVATGADKVEAIRGALRGRHVDILITDAVTAQAVLARR